MATGRTPPPACTVPDLTPQRGGYGPVHDEGCGGRPVAGVEETERDTADTARRAAAQARGKP